MTKKTHRLLGIFVASALLLPATSQQGPTSAAIDASATASTLSGGRIAFERAEGTGLSRGTPTVLGHDDAHGRGFNADITYHKGHVYLGNYGHGAQCPAAGVIVYDVREPTLPKQVNTLQLRSPS